MPVGRLKMTRDSVCAGDDCDAPHHKTIDFEPAIGILDAVRAAVASNYLASIAGGKASWVAFLDGEPIAVVAQQWSQPRFLLSARHGSGKAEAALHFSYRAQSDPNEIYSIYSSRNR